MKLYTIGFTQKSAKTFFELLEEKHMELLLDIRLNNRSQLAGFTKGSDLSYFLKRIVQCDYIHDVTFSPTKELLDDYKKGRATWGDYVTIFSRLIEERNMVRHFLDNYADYGNIVLLCSEPTPEQCHRRLVAEAIARETNTDIIHL